MVQEKQRQLLRANTWRFDLILRMPAWSGPDDVRDELRSILDKARAIHLLAQSSFLMMCQTKAVLLGFLDICTPPPMLQFTKL